jgi:hypothetical protein
MDYSITQLTDGSAESWVTPVAARAWPGVVNMRWLVALAARLTDWLLSAWKSLFLLYVQLLVVLCCNWKVS